MGDVSERCRKATFLGLDVLLPNGSIGLVVFVLTLVTLVIHADAEKSPRCFLVVCIQREKKNKIFI